MYICNVIYWLKKLKTGAKPMTKKQLQVYVVLVFYTTHFFGSSHNHFKEEEGLSINKAKVLLCMTLKVRFKNI